MGMDRLANRGLHRQSGIRLAATIIGN